MLTMPSFKKSLIVEQFQGNYLNTADLRPLKAVRNIWGHSLTVISTIFYLMKMENWLKTYQSHERVERTAVN